ncbi:hypothetical protein EAG_14279 [Camponotus floridanus]|uniref:Uncharacterized protein n=1 Tax=Camponotus floridanus TaxID=104421 RepID=E2A4E9_CAMFO|nr:hypothetical protein EAG_14279 [Camponotus floridanus]
MLFSVRTPAFKADSRDGNPPYPDTGLYRGDPVGVSGDLGPSFDAYPLLLFPRVVGLLSLRCLSPSHASYFSIPRPEIIYDPFRNRSSEISMRGGAVGRLGYSERREKTAILNEDEDTHRHTKKRGRPVYHKIKGRHDPPSIEILNAHEIPIPFAALPILPSLILFVRSVSARQFNVRYSVAYESEIKRKAAPLHWPTGTITM